MSTKVSLRHATRYTYSHPVSLGPQVIRLRPAPHARTPILRYSLDIQPAKHFLNWQQDPQGNFLARVVFPDKVGEFTVEVGLDLEMAVFNPFDFFLEPSAETFPFEYAPESAVELAPYLVPAPASPLLDTFVEGIDLAPRRTVDFLVALNRRVFDSVRYLIRMEPGVQTPEETLSKGCGSCRDSAWLLAHVLRRLGIASRFVSGYLVQLVPDKREDGGPDADFTDLHAWCEAYLPGAGWVGLDPTSGLLAGEGHIPLACSPSPGSAAPITGGVETCETEFDVSMSVTRLPDVPRASKPYDEDAWKEIDALGLAVDERLERLDVRLTMGGEPTFVSLHDIDAEEWNTAAQGPTKHVVAHRLLERLRDRFAPRGALFHGQGKQYPGESLPRWAYQCVWRRDGVPLWNDPALVAGDSTRPATDSDIDPFLHALADALGVDAGHALAGHEDAWYWLWRERRLPVNVDPHESNLADPEERARIARVFDQGLERVVGLALPLRNQSGIWESGPWRLRRELLYLHPGDSPMGFRLPLDGLPWARPDDIPSLVELDPFAPRAPFPLPRHQEHVARPTTDKPAAPAPEDVRTALCLEIRQGMLHAFLPPLARAEHWIDLVGAIESAARATGTPVRLEGYPAPRDHRLASFAITPDPGVIEVNIHPSSSWRELSDKAVVLQEEARACGLGTEKFLIDGRATGTGGGNHVTLGGITAEDSPFLRRPELLGNLIGFWLSHPSLSYAFSGLFVGPTSQAPRIDEARSDAIHELELAFRQIPSGTVPLPWIVDRVLRNVLVDATGNTHRTEFCIDKLYSPDSGTGRLGLVELRAFEMPPHERMGLVLQLLLRALVARFWDEPWKAIPPRWNNVLHDRWMLPLFLERDLDDVCSDLRDHGIPFRGSWFAPHLEFRFPKLGGLVRDGVDVEIRHALEPWHVLGEEPGGGGAVRYVDASLERLQVRVRHATPGRHSVLCNGVRVPLAPSGVEGESVGAVRFRAWDPPSALHPTIGVHAPLSFDLHDEWTGRSLGAATYHVSHPGGRAYERLPVNAAEAESRRTERFQSWGRRAASTRPVDAPTRPEAPLTLDLRWIPTDARVPTMQI